jgi:hypothetical protein
MTDHQTISDIRFSSLGVPRRIWAVSTIHGELERLYAIHDAILERMQAGDRIVYLGNITGYGRKSRETVDEILTFRRLALSQPGVKPSDIVYLRGQQEDMWQKLFQLPFSSNPHKDLQSMLESGLFATLQSYGISADDGMRAAKEGVIALTRWTMKIRERIRLNPAHDIFITQHRRAAFTDGGPAEKLLFVNAGIRPDVPLEDQGDSFWLQGYDLSDMHHPYGSFKKVIRGYDHKHRGVAINGVTASIDGGAGFGGSVVCAQVDLAGNIQELLHA